MIDGILYDTSKAEKITETSLRNLGEVIFDNMKGMNYGTIFECLTIYRTKRGRFFTECHGKLMVVDEEKVMKILGTDPELYEKVFGKVEEA